MKTLESTLKTISYEQWMDCNLDDWKHWIIYCKHREALVLHALDIQSFGGYFMTKIFVSRGLAEDVLPCGFHFMYVRIHKNDLKKEEFQFLVDWSRKNGRVDG